MLKSLPVLMYHYISKWKNPISVHPDLFEDHCRTLADKGWRGISLAQAEAFLAEGKPLPKKSLLFTFDDGFLDNYVYAWPILEKYGHKGTIFTVAGKIETGTECRRTIKDVWNGNCTEQDLPRIDQPYVPHELGFDERQDLFMNWEEARAMEASGVMHISSHSMWHASVFVSPEWDGFYHPDKRTRTFDRVNASVPWGLPRFKARPGLANRAFIPSAKLLAKVKEIVPQEKAAAYEFFNNEENVHRLRDVVEAIPANELGGLEDEQLFRARLRRELVDGKALLEQEMGRKENSLCWPWGAFCPDALAIAREVGFRTFFTTDMGANRPGCSLHVHRFKAKAKPASWLLSRVKLYASPFMAKWYAKFRI